MQDKITILKLIHKKYKDNFRKSTFAITCISASQPKFHSNIWAFWQMYNNTFMLYPTALSFNQDILCQSVVLLLPLHYILDTVPGFLCTHTLIPTSPMYRKCCRFTLHITLRNILNSTYLGHELPLLITSKDRKELCWL